LPRVKRHGDLPTYLRLSKVRSGDSFRENFAETEKRIKQMKNKNKNKYVNFKRTRFEFFDVNGIDRLFFSAPQEAFSEKVAAGLSKQFQ